MNKTQIDKMIDNIIKELEYNIQEWKIEYRPVELKLYNEQLDILLELEFNQLTRLTINNIDIYFKNRLGKEYGKKIKQKLKVILDFNINKIFYDNFDRTYDDKIFN